MASQLLVHFPHFFCCAQSCSSGDLSLQVLLEEDGDEELIDDVDGPSYADTCNSHQHQWSVDVTSLVEECSSV